MRRMESLKRLIILQLSLVGLLFHTGVYGYCWFEEYYPYLHFHVGHANFFFKGHVTDSVDLLMCCCCFFASTYGGIEDRGLKPVDVFYFRNSSLCSFANVFSYI